LSKFFKIVVGAKATTIL